MSAKTIEQILALATGAFISVTVAAQGKPVNETGLRRADKSKTKVRAVRARKVKKKVATKKRAHKKAHKVIAKKKAHKKVSRKKPVPATRRKRPGRVKKAIRR
jgi:hypothetical protein